MTYLLTTLRPAAAAAGLIISLQAFAEVWTTPENIVMRVTGTGKVNGANFPVEISTVQLVIAPADQRLLGVPERYGRAGGSDPNPRQEDY
jgi:hypothetical protein